MLDRLLMTVRNQRIDKSLTYDVIVVDNDYRESARNVVSRHSQDSSVPIYYQVEPEQNISLARNRALRSTGGLYFAGVGRF